MAYPPALSSRARQALSSLGDSLDVLRHDVFERITKFGRLGQAFLQAVQAARARGRRHVLSRRLHSARLRGISDHVLERLLNRFCRAHSKPLERAVVCERFHNELVGCAAERKGVIDTVNQKRREKSKRDSAGGSTGKRSGAHTTAFGTYHVPSQFATCEMNLFDILPVECVLT